MKKLMSLMATVVISATVLAQDTIPKAQGNLPRTNSSTTDTIPKWKKDTTTNRPSDTMRKNRPDTLKRRDAASLGNTNKWPDTTATAMSNTATASIDSSAKTTATVAPKMGKDTLPPTTNTTTASTAPKMGKDTLPPTTKTTTAMDSATTLANKSTTTDTSTTPKPVLADRVMMVDDKVMVIEKGDSTLLADSIKLKSGAVVSKDGSVKFKDGTTTKLKNGQYINLNPANNKKTKKGSKDEG